MLSLLPRSPWVSIQVGGPTIFICRVSDFVRHNLQCYIIFNCATIIPTGNECNWERVRKLGTRSWQASLQKNNAVGRVAYTHNLITWVVEAGELGITLPWATWHPSSKTSIWWYSSVDRELAKHALSPGFTQQCINKAWWDVPLIPALER